MSSIFMPRFCFKWKCLEKLKIKTKNQTIWRNRNAAFYFHNLNSCQFLFKNSCAMMRTEWCADVTTRCFAMIFTHLQKWKWTWLHVVFARFRPNCLMYVLVFLRGEAWEDQWAPKVHWGAPAHPGGWEGGAGSVPEVGQDEKSSGVHHLQSGAERNSGQTWRGNKLPFVWHITSSHDAAIIIIEHKHKKFKNTDALCIMRR